MTGEFEQSFMKIIRYSKDPFSGFHNQLIDSKTANYCVNDCL